MKSTAERERMLAMTLPETEASQSLDVRSSVLQPNQPIPEMYSAYDQNLSPALEWSGVPSEAQSIVVIMEDPDAPTEKPYVHWLIYNIPASIDRLEPSIPRTERLLQPDGAVQGRNSTGTLGYFGPKPPKGDPPHHYHFEVFALDRMLDLAPGADRDALLRAMDGHVLAKGEFVATYHHP